jgi:hypothetical protein
LSIALFEKDPHYRFHSFFSVVAQAQDSSYLNKKLGTDSFLAKYNRLYVFTGKTQVDLIDVGRWIFKRDARSRKDSSIRQAGKIYASVLPSAQSTLQTGFAVSIGGNAAFYTSNRKDENIYSITSSLNYSQRKQFFIPLEANIWLNENNFNILTDWNFSIFPQYTYGLGGFTTEQDGYPINYNYLKLYQTVLKTIAPDFYLGLGFDIDNLWNIRQVNLRADTVTDWDKYGFSSSSKSSGPTLNVLYDGRRNSINPLPGNYANLVLRSNFTFMGSDDNWSSLLVDLRKYFHFPGNTNNILALWSYNWFSLGGKPPYLNLPATASDESANLGRGYVQSRFRGTNLIYLESEYRHGISSNGLISGVVFVNAQSYTEAANKKFETILPGWGAGIRIKFNKFSRTNICLDYGFGIHGSQGIFANLGEVF